MRGIQISRVNSPHKAQWRGALMFSLICAWTNSWANNGDAGDLRRHRAHYDVTVMINGTSKFGSSHEQRNAVCKILAILTNKNIKTQHRMIDCVYRQFSAMLSFDGYYHTKKQMWKHCVPTYTSRMIASMDSTHGINETILCWTLNGEELGLSRYRPFCFDYNVNYDSGAYMLQ